MFSLLNEHWLRGDLVERHGERRPVPEFYLPARQYPVSMAELLDYDQRLLWDCMQIPRREDIVEANKPLVSPALYRYLERTTKELSVH